MVASCFGQYAFFKKERLPGGSDVFGYKAFEELLDNFVVGVSKPFVALDTVHGGFVGHRV
jgi:hypothetical protein